MKIESNSEFEKFLRESVKEIGLESPSIDFTEEVMAKVQKASVTSKSLIYRPLIAKPIWYFLAILVALVFTFTLYGSQVFGISWFSNTSSEWVDLDSFLEKIPAFDVSNIVVYGFVILAFFMCVQVVLLKHHFDRRMV